MAHTQLAIPPVIDRTRPRYLSPCTMPQNGLLHSPAFRRLCQLHHPCKVSAASRSLSFQAARCDLSLSSWPCISPSVPELCRIIG